MSPLASSLPSSSSSPSAAAAAGVGGGSIIIIVDDGEVDTDAAGDASGRDGIATLAWRRWRRRAEEEDIGGRVSTLLVVVFTSTTAPSTGGGAGAAVAAEGVTQPGPKKPAAAGVPGESGAVAVATTGQALASEADTVRETRRPSLPSCSAAAVPAAVDFLGVAGAPLGVQQLLMHLSQTRFGGVWARRTCFLVAGGRKERGTGDEGALSIETRNGTYLVLQHTGMHAQGPVCLNSTACCRGGLALRGLN